MSEIEQEVERLIADFSTLRWNDPRYAAIFTRIASEPELSFPLSLRVIAQNTPKAHALLNRAYSNLNEEAWKHLIPKAIQALQVSKNEAADDVLMEAYFYDSTLLMPHLKDLFFADNYSQTRYKYMSWRDAGAHHISYLREELRNPERRQQAIGALLELRLPEAFSLIPEEVHEDYFLNVGFVREEGRFRRLYSHELYHIHFSTEYLSIEGSRHDTYQEIDERLYRFGGLVEGQLCPCCGDKLHHLLTFPAATLLPDICSIPSLTLATCTNCLGWEEAASPLVLNHNERGIPVASAPQSPKTPEFDYYAPFQETTVALTPTQPRYRWQEWGDSNGKNLHRLGGHPSWVQSGYYPDCPKCRRSMTFLLQLDSNLPLLRQDTNYETEILWGSGGLAYFYWCDACRISAGNWQCT
jgi:hypothetical protein